MSTNTNMEEFLSKYGPAGVSQMLYVLAERIDPDTPEQHKQKVMAYQMADDLKTALSYLRSDPSKQLKGVELRLQRRIANGSVSPVSQG